MVVRFRYKDCPVSIQVRRELHYARTFVGAASTRPSSVELRPCHWQGLVRKLALAFGYSVRRFLTGSASRALKVSAPMTTRAMSPIRNSVVKKVQTLTDTR